MGGGGVEGAAFGNVFAFEVCADDGAFGGVVLEGDGGGEGDDVEPGLFGEDALHVGEIVGVVGDEAEDAAGHEDAVDFLHEGDLDGAAFIVTGFGPGVGEVDVEGVDGGVGDVAADPPEGFAVDESGVGEAVAAHAVGGEEGVFAGPFEADVVVFRFGLGDGEEEGAFAGADFEFDRVGVAEEGGEVELAGFVGDLQEIGVGVEVGAKGHGGLGRRNGDGEIQLRGGVVCGV